MIEHSHVLASRWKRFAGALLDFLSVLVVMVLAILNEGMERFRSLAEINPAEYPDYFAEQFGEYILSITYSPVLIVGFLVLLNVNLYFLVKNGQTIGKKMVGSRMVSAATGNKVSFLRIIFLRYVPFGLAFIPNLGKLLNLLDGLFIFRADRRCIHDLIAGTVVVDATRGSDFTVDSSHDSDFYDQVAEEIESDNLIPGVWTRAFAEADGDENRAKALYIKLRVAALASDEHLVSEEPLEAKRPKKKGFGFWFLILLFSFLAVMLLGEWVDYYQNINSKPAMNIGPQERCKWTAQLESNVEMEFMPIPAGSFLMGSNNGDENERPVHRVMLSKPFWLAKTEVTQRQYNQVMESNPSHFQGSNNPVEKVSWNDAVSFCKKLTEIERRAGRLPEGFEYTLPTEAQWEYACRAGTTGDYAGSLDSMAWYGYEKAGKKTHPVGTKQANAWGLYDMHGHVWEWCSDWYGDYPSGSVKDPQGANSGSYRVLRGGGWYDGSSICRSAFRSRYSPAGTCYYLGFRPLVQQK